MAALTPQTILWEIERLLPAGTLVEAATSQSRQRDVAQSASLLAPHRAARLQRFVVLAATRTAHIKPFCAITSALLWATPRTSVTAQSGRHVGCNVGDSAVDKTVKLNTCDNEARPVKPLEQEKLIN